MKAKKQDGKGQDAPTDHAKTKLKKAYGKSVRRLAMRAINKFIRETDI